MSLSAMLAAHDDAALEALANKGLMRRAARDAAAGKARILARSAAEARVDADGQEVLVPAAGPGAARCGCPATGICRHVLLAVLALRDAPQGEADMAAPAADPAGDPAAEAVLAAPPETAPETALKIAAPAPDSAAPPAAQAALLALSEADLRAFAGPRWNAALHLAAAGGHVAPGPASCAVEIDGARVTFIAAEGPALLRGAALRGPEARRRLLVVAAALRVRLEAGAPPPAPDAAAPDAPEQASPDFCRAAARAVEETALAIALGAADSAADRLFDLAVSARAEAAPRLAAQLRGLSETARAAAMRAASAPLPRSLGMAARAAALAEALARAPSDPALRGAVQRRYLPAPACRLLGLGVSGWRAASGARGATLHLFDPDGARFLSVSAARGAGMDPGFGPVQGWNAPLWGVGRLRDLPGRLLQAEAPRIAGDGALAPGMERAAPLPHDPGAAAALKAAAIEDWSAVRPAARARLGRGLRRRAAPVPLLLAPAALSAPAPDPAEGGRAIHAADAGGGLLRLQLPPGAHAPVEAGIAGAAPPLLLVEALAGEEGLAFRLVSALRIGAEGIAVCDLQFEAPEAAQTAGLVGRLRAIRAAAPPAPGPRPALGPLPRLCAEAAACAGELLIAPAAARPEAERLAEEARMLGLDMLAAALGAAAQAPSARRALGVVWIAGELPLLAD